MEEEEEEMRILPFSSAPFIQTLPGSELKPSSVPPWGGYPLTGLGFRRVTVAHCAGVLWAARPVMAAG